ncbi:deoxycytidylate deaminase isoform X3 [Passer domesticus]|uniref:deoxycytidylate deaminase isoform X3 n=1 Tax=Passer domesticus TaxID=48849 RepID=UPI0030FF0778
MAVYLEVHNLRIRMKHKLILVLEKERRKTLTRAIKKPRQVNRTPVVTRDQRSFVSTAEQLHMPHTEASCKKREDYLEWPEYFMAVAFLSAQRSKDPSSQVGACIVNSENKIVGIGYNGMPNGCSDDVLPWTRTGENRLDTKYPYVCHAELNAIMNKNSADVKGCSMYVALFPCNECAKLIIQAGIKEVIFMSDKYHDTTEMTAARRMFDLAGIIYREFKPKCNKIIIDFDSINSRPSQKLL